MSYNINFLRAFKQQPAVKMIALLIFILFITGCLLSEMFILTHSDHEHDHNGREGSCTVCINITTAEDLLRVILPVLFGAVIVFYKFTDTRVIIRPTGYCKVFYNPILLKVRINN